MSKKRPKSKVTSVVPAITEHPNVAREDWRVFHATATTAPAILNGKLLPEGSVVKVATPIQLSKKGPSLSFGAPSVTALLLDVAVRSDIASQDLVHQITSAAACNPHSVPDQTIFDGLEARMTSIVFAFSAVESFANEIIENAYGNGYRYEPIGKDGLSVSYDLETIEMRLRIDEKVGQVVPDALGLTSPKGRTPWNNFKRLKDLRDRIIHVKGRDRGNSLDRSLMRELLSKKSSNFGRGMFALIGSFYDQIPHQAPRWYRAWPWR